MKCFRSSILHLLEDPLMQCKAEAYEFYEDGMLVVDKGHVVEVGPAASLKEKYSEAEHFEYTNALIVPGFIDTHVHYPQVDVIASHGSQLLDWLENHTFPTEKHFSNVSIAEDAAEFFLNQLLLNGTTTAMVFGSVHKVSVDVFFRAAEKRNLRMICGKALMDRNVPEYLKDTADSGYQDSKELIERWHGKGRLSYAVTPRFAAANSEAQLALSGQLLREYDGVFMQTHLSENKEEVEWVRQLFPDRESYLDVYHHYGLTGRRSIFAHGIHLNESEYECLSETGSGIAFCPTSNLFLGSGLFNLDKTEQYSINTGLATDVGAGTSFSMLQTMNEAYKVQQLRKRSLSPLKSLYLSTLGAARTLDLHDKIGNFEKGKEADFVVLDLEATDLIKRRVQCSNDVLEKFFAISMLGDDRAVKAVYILGDRA